MGEHRRRAAAPVEQVDPEAAAAHAAWSAKLRAASASDADRDAARAALIERGQASKEANHACLAACTDAALHAAGRLRDERKDHDRDREKDHPMRVDEGGIVQAFWPEPAGPNQPRPLKPVY